MMKDIKVKRANFIAKNCELLQEFHFAHPATKFKIIMSFNSHFTGSPTWDLFSIESIKLENSWNVNFKKFMVYRLMRTGILLRVLRGKHT